MSGSTRKTDVCQRPGLPLVWADLENHTSFSAVRSHLAVAERQPKCSMMCQR